MIAIAPSQSFAATTEPGYFATGLVGTVGVRILDDSGNTITARATANIIELVSGSGIYSATALTSPSAAGQYTIYWDDAAASSYLDDLVVTYSSVSPVTPSGSDLTTLARVKDWLGL